MDGLVLEVVDLILLLLISQIGGADPFVQTGMKVSGKPFELFSRCAYALKKHGIQPSTGGVKRCGQVGKSAPQIGQLIGKLTNRDLLSLKDFDEHSVMPGDDAPHLLSHGSYVTWTGVGLDQGKKRISQLVHPALGQKPMAADLFTLIEQKPAASL